MSAVETLFAPSERATPQRLEHDAAFLKKAGLPNHITHAIPLILMVLNKNRQLVYANQKLIDHLGISSQNEILGLRAGEILDCIHSHNPCNGCGTSEFCRECGAVNAILKAQNEQIETEMECCITTRSGTAHEFKVWASPYGDENNEYTLFTLLDIHDEKRRQVLEQTFLHDLTNVLTAISGHSQLLETCRDENDINHSNEAIRVASEELTAEIWCHRKLLRAEHGEFEVELVKGIHSCTLANELINLFSERNIVLDPNSESFEITTDRVLLFRVILNMLKNAHESAGPEETVTISCRQEYDTGIFSVHNPNFMPRSTQLRMFQRSFTTKGKGHGIGTYSMRMFGEKFLKGKVGFTTSKQTGTTFYIALPLEFPEH